MIKKIFPLVIVAMLLYACGGSESDTPDNNSDNFDRSIMLKNYAENHIVPAFMDFDSKLQALKDKTDSFTQQPSVTSLEELRTAWYNAYKIWQHVAKYNIGKAEELQFVNFFNVYPLNVVDLEENIKNGSYDLNHSNNYDAQGFPAIDYFIYGLGTDTEILSKFSTDENAIKYKKYLTDVVMKMNSISNQIVTDWQNSYTNVFTASTKNTATSSLNKLVNDIVYYYEKRLRANKIGIPAGNFSSTVLPEKVEALYRKDISKVLALEALNSFQDFFEGKAYNGASTGQSLKTYLEALNRQDLVIAITSQLNVAKTAINALDDNFYNQITTDNTKMTKAYDELQKVVRYLKVDMLQAFNVSVDYVDADGD